MPHIHRHPQVEDDIFEAAAYLIERSPAAARRFVDAVETTLKNLAHWRRIGSRKSFSQRQLAGIRTWHIAGFRNYLIYYMPAADGIYVLAILHGARDAPPILGDRA